MSAYSYERYCIGQIAFMSASLSEIPPEFPQKTHLSPLHSEPPANGNGADLLSLT